MYVVTLSSNPLTFNSLYWIQEKQKWIERVVAVWLSILYIGFDREYLQYYTVFDRMLFQFFILDS